MYLKGVWGVAVWRELLKHKFECYVIENKMTDRNQTQPLATFGLFLNFVSNF